MRYRKLDENGDMVFGGGLNAFYINVPAAPAQAVATRLWLNRGEWFLDTTDGTPWMAQVLGKNTGGTRDLVLKQRVLGTVGVDTFVNFSSQLSAQRAYTVTMQLNTIYGSVNLVTEVVDSTI